MFHGCILKVQTYGTETITLIKNSDKLDCNTTSHEEYKLVISLTGWREDQTIGCGMNNNVTIQLYSNGALLDT